MAKLIDSMPTSLGGHIGDAVRR